LVGLEIYTEASSGYYAHVPSVGSDFTPLEHAVLRAICEMHPVDQAALEGQLSTAMILSRKNTALVFTFVSLLNTAPTPQLGANV
jgi:hypothetical protein